MWNTQIRFHILNIKKMYLLFNNLLLRGQCYNARKLGNTPLNKIVFNKDNKNKNKNLYCKFISKYSSGAVGNSDSIQTCQDKFCVLNILI